MAEITTLDKDTRMERVEKAAHLKTLQQEIDALLLEAKQPRTNIYQSEYLLDKCLNLISRYRPSIGDINALDNNGC